MKTSENGRNLIRRFEGLELDSYLCPSGVWTIGYGHTKGVKENETITPSQAELYLTEDILECEDAIARLVTADLTQNGHDALVSFIFNLGEGNFKNSTLRKKINAGRPVGEITVEFKKWVHSNGKVLKGLVLRRDAEAELWARG